MDLTSIHRKVKVSTKTKLFFFVRDRVINTKNMKKDNNIGKWPRMISRQSLQIPWR